MIQNISRFNIKNNTLNNRSSGIELLRIIALLFVILIHYSDAALSLLTPEKGLGGLIFLRSLSSGAVDIFIIISGYFLCKVDNRPLGKPISLLAQVIYRNLIVYLLAIYLGYEIFSFRGLSFRLVPSSYYPILFCALYLVSPWLNIVFRQERSLRILIVTLIILFSAWPTLVDFSEEFMYNDWFGLSTIGAKGAQSGLNIVNFILLYYIGGFLRIVELPQVLQKRGVLIFTAIILTIIIFTWASFEQSLALREMRSAWCYHNPLVICLAITLFLLFKKIQFRSVVVNTIAKVTYLCFLIHSGIMGNIDIGIAKACEYGFGHLMINYVAFTVIMFAFSGLALIIYNKLFNPIINKLNRYSIPYKIL